MFKELIAAMIIVESGGDPNAVGKNGELGILQQKEIFVNDVNRIMELQHRKRRYTYEDRLNPERAKDMADEWLHHYYRIYGLDHDYMPSILDMAGIYNAGYNGYITGAWKSEQVQVYQEKVKDVILNKIESQLRPNIWTKTKIGRAHV